MMECVKQGVNVYRQGMMVSDQFYIEDDYNVPDQKCDVRSVIMSKGELTEVKYEKMDNYIRMSGKLDFRVLYYADEMETRITSLNGQLPFEEMIYTEAEVMEPLYLKSSRVEVSVQVIHSRKLSIKAVAEVCLISNGSERLDLTTDVEAEFPVYKRYETREILELQKMTRDTYRIKEEITIDGTKESVAEILWSDVLKRRVDTRVETDTLKIQGEVQLFVMYVSLDGKPDYVCQNIPYEMQLHCEGLAEGMYHQVTTKIMDVNVEPRMDEDGEVRLLGVEATLEVRLLAYTEEKIRLLEDLYSLEKHCEPQYAETQCDRLLMQNHSKCKLSEKMSLPEIKDDILQVCHSDGMIQMENIKQEEQGLLIEGILHVQFLYVKPDDAVPFAMWSGMLPFAHMLESNEMPDTMCHEIVGTVEQLGISLLGNGEIEVKAVLSFDSFLKAPVRIQNLCAVEESSLDYKELEKGAGIIGYIVKEGDDLWSLAKRYNTTKEGIMEVNEMTSEALENGDKLLIFRENISIL